LFDIARDFFSCFVFWQARSQRALERFQIQRFGDVRVHARVCTSLTKTLAVMAMTGMLCASGWSEARMSRVGQTVSLKKPSHREKLFDG
jgi:hypothetical protein